MMYYSDVVTKNMQSIDGFSHICISGLSTHKDKPDYKHEIFILIFLLKALF